MKIKISHILIIVNTIFIIYLLIKINTSKYNIAFIDYKSTFENFNMTRDLKKIGDLNLNKLRTEIDSLVLAVNDNTLSNTKESSMKLLIMKREQLKEFEYTYTSNETSKIIDRINKYAKAFALQNDYTFLFSLQDNSGILFGEQKNNVTLEFIKYINKQYEGEN
jgi:outer membrane protein